MKKTLLYLLAAAILGILVTVVPLITVVKFTTVAKTAIGGSTQLAPQPRSIGQGLKQLEGGSGLNSSQVNISDLTVLAISIIIALLAYTLVRRERGHGLES